MIKIKKKINSSRNWVKILHNKTTRNLLSRSLKNLSFLLLIFVHKHLSPNPTYVHNNFITQIPPVCILIQLSTINCISSIDSSRKVLYFFASIIPYINILNDLLSCEIILAKKRKKIVLRK